MDTFLGLPRERQAELCERAADEMGISSAAIEKDFWVCWALRALFRSDAGPHLTFKGGTSLSKGWGLIERFSEDIDLVVDRAHLGFHGGAAPEAAKSKNKRKLRVGEVSAACRQYVSRVLQPALVDSVGAASTPTVTADADEPMNLRLNYQSFLPTSGYLSPVVKIELGARSDTEPHRTPTISPYLARVPSMQLQDASFVVKAVAPERTFWEKVALLHEEVYSREAPDLRMARHYYDLWCLDRKGIAANALADPDLFTRVVVHRRLYFSKKAEAQRALVPGLIQLKPTDNQRHLWREDFERMREAMFFGEPPEFETIMAVVGDLEQRINQLPQPSSGPGGAP